MKNQNGNSILMISLLIMTVSITLLLFLIAIFMGVVNGMIHHVKTDMYLINKTAILSINNNKASRDSVSYQKNEFLEHFKNGMKKNYQLDDNLENMNGFIQQVMIQEYELYHKNQKDHFTKETVKEGMIHSVIQVKIKPIILEKQLQPYFTFLVHEDVKLELFEHEK